MKKYILIIIMLVAVWVTATVSAQNFIGKTSEQITKILDEKNIAYETYYTIEGSLGIRFETDYEKRVYAINENDICYYYIVASNEVDFVYRMRRYAVKNGFKLRYSTGDYTYTYVNGKYKLIVGNVSEDVELLQGWNYFMVYQLN